MASRAKKIIDEKVESLKLLTGNSDIIVKYCNGKYGLFEEWTSCYHRVLGSSGYYDMSAKEMNIYLDGLIAGLSEAKKMYSNE